MPLIEIVPPQFDTASHSAPVPPGQRAFALSISSTRGDGLSRSRVAAILKRTSQVGLGWPIVGALHTDPCEVMPIYSPGCRGAGCEAARPGSRSSEAQRGSIRARPTMSLLKPVTPEEAKRVWVSIPNPSARRVAKALTQSGRRVHHSTVARWRAQDWRPVANALGISLNSNRTSQPR